MTTKITMLGGGVGCSRVAVPLARTLQPGELTLVVNTADDLWRYGLRICPDLDTNLYALSGRRDEERGWGLTGDTFVAMEQLRALGHDAWFNLGDHDLATHLLRTSLLRSGLPLSTVTSELVERTGIQTRLLPMTDSEVGSRIVMADGTHEFQEWFVRRGAAGPVTEVEYGGIESAVPSPGVLDAIANADLVVIGPSNPVSSIEPILALPGIREQLAARRASVMAVTPVVTAIPVDTAGDDHRTRAARALMDSRGLPHTATAVAGLYRDLASSFILDSADAAEAAAIEDLGLEVIVANTLITDPPRGDRLAEALVGRASGQIGDERPE